MMFDKKKPIRAFKGSDEERKKTRQGLKRQPSTDVDLKKESVYTVPRSSPTSSSLTGKNRALLGLNNRSVRDAYQFLRTKVISRMQEEGWNILAVTSPGKGEGKTLTAINLAISISQTIDTTVLLVDADLRNPNVHHYFGLDLKEGLIDYITNGVSLDTLLVHPAIPRLVLLPGGAPDEKEL
ncbi:MAG: exopolysaccharide biosynthesis protein, partial [Nitrospiria bacterium]